MIIWIDDDVVNSDFAADEAVCAGIESTFMAVFRGEHYVFAKRATLDALSKVSQFGAVTRGLIQKSENALTQAGELMSIVEPKVTIVRSGLVERSPNGSKWRVPISVVGAIGLRAVTLLTENVVDAQLLIQAAHHYRISVRLGASRVVAEQRGGGGSGIAHEFKLIVNARAQFCLCITDSDRKCADDELSPTSKKCADSAQTSWVASHVALDEREIENLIPHRLTEKIVDAGQQQAWATLMAMCAACKVDLFSFCDLKEGTFVSDVLAMPKDSPSGAFWRGVLGSLADAQLFSLPCGDDACGDREACICDVTPGFGERLVSKAVAYLEERSFHAAHLLVKDDARVGRWFDVGREVFEWCCAPPSVRV